MKIYRCRICGFIYDEVAAGKPFSTLRACPVCQAALTQFEATDAPHTEAQPAASDTLAYAAQYARTDEAERHMETIHAMATSGKSAIDAMGIRQLKPSWDDILLLGAQLNPLPLDERAAVDTSVIIGKRAKQPLRLSMPVFISHMSFGALSREAKIALAKGSAQLQTAMCSGEGGILEEERAAAHKYIFEYVPNRYGDTDENLRAADAIEIKIGQGTKPGMGGHLPVEKVTPEIAALRKMPLGQDIISPSRFPGIETKEDLKALVDSLRRRSGGRPIGVKIAAGRIERDLACICFAAPDFITIDGRGGATGASPKLVRDATSLPTIYALHRAKKYLRAHRADIDLIITGGLRVSSDFAKALAMGADAVAIASAALIALACQQYRICQSGKCPMGIATQDPVLRSRLQIEQGAQRVANFLRVTQEELTTFARITGHSRLCELNVDDLCTLDTEIAAHTDISHA